MHQLDIKRLELLHCGDYCLLKYSYFVGSSEVQYFKQYSGICKMLFEIHSLGYCHGDIRPSNMVFNGDTGYLVDYDLAGKENELYPLGYVSKQSGNEFRMRHRLAIQKNRMKKDHDIHALKFLMNEFKTTESGHTTKKRKILTSFTTQTLCTIGDALSLLDF